MDFSAASIIFCAVIASSSVLSGFAPMPQAVDQEVPDLVGDRALVGRVGLRVDEPRLDLDVVAVAVARAAGGADHLDHDGPRVGGVVVGGEAGAEVGQRAVVEPHLHHRDVFLRVLLVVQRRLHRAQFDRLADEVEQDVRVVREDLPDDAGVALRDLFGVVDVVHDVARTRSCRGRRPRPVRACASCLLVDVVVPRHAHELLRVGQVAHLLDLGDRHADRLLDQDVLAGARGRAWCIRGAIRGW